MSKASVILHASQPTISLQIKKLETELDVKLFKRSGPKLSITTEGEILYNLALPLVRGLDHLEDEFISQQTDLVTGELTIAAEESTILYTLADPISKFVKKYPGIRLKISNVTGSNGREQVLADEVDFAVSSMLHPTSNLDYKPFISYPAVLLTPLGHPLSTLKTVTINDIGQYGLILPPSKFSSWRLIKMIFDLEGVAFNVALEAGGWEVIKKFVTLNLGVSIVTSICIEPQDKDKFAIISLDRLFPNRQFGVVTKKQTTLSSPAHGFIDILYDHYADNKKVHNPVTN